LLENKPKYSQTTTKMKEGRNKQTKKEVSKKE
jgi:hypothetical protein